MTSLEIAALVEESEQNRAAEADPEPEHGARRLTAKTLVLIALSVLVLAAGGYYLSARGAPQATQSPTPVVPAEASRSSHAATPGSTAGSSVDAGQARQAASPVPVSEYFSVKNPFAPKITSQANAALTPSGVG
ncbi:MAG: hypothetical protein MP439_08240 [Ferrimicrobium sp.]|jgi:hypothetical protein|nr:hypothetical protein [Ferrimicrobium sp.]